MEQVLNYIKTDILEKSEKISHSFNTLTKVVEPDTASTAKTVFTTQDMPTENKLINKETTVGTVKKIPKSLSMLPYIDRAKREHFRPIAKYAQRISPIFFHIREEYINSLIHALKNYVFKEAIVKLFCRDISIIEINQYNPFNYFNQYNQFKRSDKFNESNESNKSNKNCQSTFSITLSKDNINIEYLSINDTFTRDKCIFDLNIQDNRTQFINFIKNLDSSGLMKDVNHLQSNRVVSLKF